MHVVLGILASVNLLARSPKNCSLKNCSVYKSKYTYLGRDFTTRKLFFEKQSQSWHCRSSMALPTHYDTNFYWILPKMYLDITNIWAPHGIPMELFGGRRWRFALVQVTYMKYQNTIDSSRRTITKFVWQLGRHEPTSASAKVFHCIATAN